MTYIVCIQAAGHGRYPLCQVAKVSIRCAAAAVGGATSGVVIGTLDVPAGFGNNTAATVVELPSTIEQVL